MSPDRFNSELYLTTSQVAELLAVHASTVKRWCNEGDLSFDKTGGGHRRIHLDDVLALARERDIATFLTPFTPYEGHVWSAFSTVLDGGSFHRVHALAMGWLLRGKVERVARLFLELGRHPQVGFEAFCDEGIRGFMSEVGEEWREGRLRVAEEHMLSEILTEVLLEIRSQLSPHPDAHLNGTTPRPVAVVGAMEGDRHTLGSLCIRMELERMGWRVLFLGADVPVEDFAAIQGAQGARVVCVSFAPPRTGADMRRCVRILSEFYDPAHPFALALGGMAAPEADLSDLDTPFVELGVFASVAAFHEALAGGFAAAPAVR